MVISVMGREKERKGRDIPGEGGEEMDYNILQSGRDGLMGKMTERTHLRAGGREAPRQVSRERISRRGKTSKGPKTTVDPAWGGKARTPSVCGTSEQQV